MNHRTTRAHSRADHARPAERRFRPPVGARRPGVYLSVAAAGAVLVNVLGAAGPGVAETPTESMSIARQLGVSQSPAPLDEDTVRPLEQLAASRSDREAEQSAAARAQADAEKKEQQARAAAEQARREAAEKAAAEKAAAEKAAADRAAAEAAAPASSAAPAPGGSYQDYALAQLGGDSGQFGCLENLWGRESGWNPNAQNPSSSAYGIPQFLDSTWASTGIAKTSDPYRQIDAGLIYINSRYGSPCGAWGHSQSTGWY